MEYISKKELLEMTGISYGQLYRWKRERLIPEVWFVKRSSFTGQETFLPKEQILQRVQFILDMKDTHSLEEIAEMLSINMKSRELDYRQLLDMEDIDGELAEFQKKETYSLRDVVYLVILSRIRREHEVPLEQMRALFEGTGDFLEHVDGAGYEFRLIQAGYGYYGIITNDRSEVYCDIRLKEIAVYSFDALAAELREKYAGVSYAEKQ